MQGGWCLFIGYEISNNLWESINYGSPYTVLGETAQGDDYGLLWVIKYGPAPTSYTCPSGGSLSGTTCTITSSSAASISSYYCNSGVLTGSQCSTTVTVSATAN